METVESEDGTPIAIERVGTGPPVVLVHGTAADRRDWEEVRPFLAEEATVLALDRRGRGQSGDGQRWELEREAEDIAAVVDSLGERATLVGHSFGGLCSIEAALLAENVETLVLYDPVVPVGDEPLIAVDAIEALEVYVERGDREEALTYFLEDIAGMPSQMVEAMRGSPVWEGALEAAPTIAREVRAVNDYRFEPERLKDLRTHTLLIRGELSPDYLQAATAALAQTLPNHRVVTLAGHGHGAIYEAPKDFADVVLGHGA